MPEPATPSESAALWRVHAYGREQHPVGKRYWWDSAVRPADGTVVLQMTTRGDILFRDEHGEQAVRPGTLMVFTHGEAVRYGRPEPLTAPYACLWLGLRGAGLAEHARAFVERFGPLPAVGLDHPLVEQMERLVVASSATQPPPAAATSVAAAIHRLILGLFEFAEQRLRQQLAPVDQAIEAILHRQQQPESLKEIAQAHGVSREHLSRRFHERTGRLAKDVLAEARLQHALALLRQTGLPLTEVARQAGYAHYHSFARHVRQAAGQTPTAFRASSLPRPGVTPAPRRKRAGAHRRKRGETT